MRLQPADVGKLLNGALDVVRLLAKQIDALQHGRRRLAADHHHFVVVIIIIITITVCIITREGAVNVRRGVVHRHRGGVVVRGHLPIDDA